MRNNSAIQTLHFSNFPLVQSHIQAAPLHVDERGKAHAFKKRPLLVACITSEHDFFFLTQKEEDRV